MTKENKVTAIQEIKDLLKDAKNVYVVNLNTLNAATTSDFRRQAFKNNITLKVVKNTLLQKAMEQTEGVDYSEMFETFKGNSALLISDIANGPAKLIKTIRKKGDYPALKSAILDGTVYVGDENLETLANIKSKEEMLGEIIGLLQSPIRNVIAALQNQDKMKGGASESEGTEDAKVDADKPAETAAEEPAKGEDTPAAE